MKKYLKHPLMAPLDSLWVLLGLTAVCWLFVVAWMFKTTSFGGGHSRLVQNERQTLFKSYSLTTENDSAAGRIAPGLEVIEFVDSDVGNSELKADTDSARMRVLTRPIVTHVDVSNLTAQDQAEELLLNSELVGLTQAREWIFEDELAILEGLSPQIRFNSESNSVNPELEGVLDRMFDPLYLYSEPRVFVTVATNELTGAATNNLLSRDRGQSIIAYWVNRGLEVDRFSIFIESGDELPLGTHRVQVVPVGISR